MHRLIGVVERLESVAVALVGRGRRLGSGVDGGRRHQSESGSFELCMCIGVVGYKARIQELGAGSQEPGDW